MARQWTDEERQKQAQAIRRWQPWRQSTGPKTAAGKKKCRMNALKHGLYTPEGEIIRKMFLHNREFVKLAEQFFSMPDLHDLQALRERSNKRP